MKGLGFWGGEGITVAAQDCFWKHMPRKASGRRKAVFSWQPGTGDSVVAGAGEAVESSSPGDVPGLWGGTALRMMMSADVSLCHAIPPWLIRLGSAL